MRGKLAKLIRREVYGEKSLRQHRKYVIDGATKVIMNHPQSDRALYQKVKRGWKDRHENPVLRSKEQDK